MKFFIFLSLVLAANSSFATEENKSWTCDVSNTGYPSNWPKDQMRISLNPRLIQYVGQVPQDDGSFKLGTPEDLIDNDTLVGSTLPYKISSCESKLSEENGYSLTWSCHNLSNGHFTFDAYKSGSYSTIENVFGSTISRTIQFSNCR